MTMQRVLADTTVVIPTVGRPLLEDCLRSILRSESWPARLLVVDQSEDGYAAGPLASLQAAGMATEHLQMPRRGIAAGMNLGLAEVTTDVVAVTHDDCRVNLHWLDRIRARVVGSDQLIVATGPVLPEPGREVPSTITATRPAVYRRPLIRRDVLFPANMALSTEVWRRVGPMDEDPLLKSASEDNEWAYRALRASVPICYVPEAVVTHVAWRDARALARVEWDYARAQGAMYGKYLRRGDLHFLLRLGYDLPHALWSWVRGRAGRDGTLANRGRAGTVGLLQGLAAGLLRGQPPPRSAERGRVGI